MQLDKITPEEREAIFQQTPVLYKYLDFNGGMNMIKNRTIKLANLQTINDPYDCYVGLVNWIPELLDNSNEFVRKSVLATGSKTIRQLISIASFSNSFNNLSLWGNYNYHQGVCIGLDTKKLYDYIRAKNYPIDFVKVEYIDEFPPMSVEEAKKGNKDIITDHLVRLKSKAWEKENEIRLVYVAKPDSNYQIPIPEFIPISPEIFVEFYLGSNLLDNDNVYTLEERMSILVARLAKLNKKIKLYQTELKPDRFELYRTKLPILDIINSTKRGFEKFANELNE